MGNVIMKAQQIAYGASNIEKALDDLSVPELIELNKRMDAIDAWKANVHEETYTGSELTIENALALPARSLITEINAIQNLHGYDKPWVGGAGKNNCPYFTGTTVANIEYTVANDGKVSFTGTPSGPSEIRQDVALKAGTYIVSGAPAGSVLGSKDIYVQLSGTTVARSYDGVTESAATFTLSEDATVRINLRVASSATETAISGTYEPMIRPSTESSGYAPYSNISPISGRDSVVVDDEGINLIDIAGRTISTTNAVTTIRTEGCTATKSGQVIETSITAGWSKLQMLFDGNLLKDGETYTFSAVYENPNNNRIQLAYMYQNESSWTSLTSIVTDRSVRLSGQFTYDASKGRYFVLGCVVNNTNSSTNNKVYVSNIMFEIGSQATAYVPYRETVSVTIQLGQTVYGGSVDFTTGVATVKKAIKDMGDMTWYRNTTEYAYPYFYANISDRKTGTQSPLISSCYPTGTDRSSLSDNMLAPYNLSTSNAVAVRADAYTDASTFKTAMDGQTICYELAEPIELTLTPTEVQMLKGYNRVTIDNGSIELKALVLGGDN